jgi:hypothetical protein
LSKFLQTSVGCKREYRYEFISSWNAQSLQMGQKHSAQKGNALSMQGRKVLLGSLATFVAYISISSSFLKIHTQLPERNELLLLDSSLCELNPWGGLWVFWLTLEWCVCVCWGGRVHGRVFDVEIMKARTALCSPLTSPCQHNEQHLVSAQQFLAEYMDSSPAPIKYGKYEVSFLWPASYCTKHLYCSGEILAALFHKWSSPGSWNSRNILSVMGPERGVAQSLDPQTLAISTNYSVSNRLLPHAPAVSDPATLEPSTNDSSDTLLWRNCPVLFLVVFLASTHYSQ